MRRTREIERQLATERNDEVEEELERKKRVKWENYQKSLNANDADYFERKQLALAWESGRGGKVDEVIFEPTDDVKLLDGVRHVRSAVDLKYPSYEKFVGVEYIPMEGDMDVVPVPKQGLKRRGRLEIGTNKIPREFGSSRKRGVIDAGLSDIGYDLSKRHDHSYHPEFVSDVGVSNKRSRRQHRGIIPPHSKRMKEQVLPKRTRVDIDDVIDIVDQYMPKRHRYDKVSNAVSDFEEIENDEEYRPAWLTEYEKYREAEDFDYKKSPEYARSKRYRKLQKDDIIPMSQNAFGHGTNVVYDTDDETIPMTPKDFRHGVNVVYDSEQELTQAQLGDDATQEQNLQITQPQYDTAEVLDNGFVIYPSAYDDDY